MGWRAWFRTIAENTVTTFAMAVQEYVIDGAGLFVRAECVQKNPSDNLREKSLNAVSEKYSVGAA